MTDNEIIKAWENEIHLAEYVDSDYCSNVEVSLIKETINTFNRQKAEIKRLEEMLDSAVSSEENAVDTTNYMIAEAVKEFVERLYQELRMYGIKDKFNKAIFLNVVDKAKKELVGEKNGQIRYLPSRKRTCWIKL